MAYVEAHAGLRDHLKTKKVARLLGIPKVQVIGHMLCLWWWCQEYAQDGNLSPFDNADIAEAAEWTNDPDTFVNALSSCGPKDGAGFLVLNNEGELIVNDWYEYGGKLFVQREQSAKRMRNMRARDASVTRNMPVTVTHVTPIDKIREDKIREDKNNSFASTDAPSPPPAHVPVAAKEPKAKTPSAQSEMFGAVAECCQLDGNLKANKGRVGKTAADLVNAGYTPDQVKAFPAWWRANDWRAKTSPVPGLAQVTEKIAQSLNGDVVPPANGNGKAHTQSVQAVHDYFALKKEMEATA